MGWQMKLSGVGLGIDVVARRIHALVNEEVSWFGETVGPVVRGVLGSCFPGIKSGWGVHTHVP